MRRVVEIEPGSSRDRCSRCGGWISMGHAIGSTCRASADDPQNSDGLRKQEETPKALEAAADRIRWTDIGPLACGESPASLLPSEAFLSQEQR